ncbi:LysE family translocator [Cohaesibacter intestini]|uniref:LysE family translocator n=1 Tax=Cohaesibacter intestini TaxID=2211145 RepID=UPI000DE8506F|nr:LysE family translocator [Cohaesibacter intestini]
MTDINLPLIMGASLLAMASPGPATLAIAATSMSHGRKHGLALASGVTTGSFLWSLAAALGMGAVMAANVWLFEVMRYFGAGYLLFLALKSARSAMTPTGLEQPVIETAELSLGKSYLKGLAIHLTNPKAILFIGSIYALGLPAEATPTDLITVVLLLGSQSALVCQLYAWIFASRPVVSGYRKTRRALDAVFAMLFGVASLRILTSTFGH